MESVTNENFDQVVIQSEVPVLVDFFAEWCGPCKLQTPILSELAGEYGDKVKIAKVDIDGEGNKDLAVKYGVANVPTLILFNKGEIVETLVGVTKKNKLADKFDQLL